MFKSFILGVLLSTQISTISPLPEVMAEVDRTEDGDYAVTLVYVTRQDREDVYLFDIPQADYNQRKEDGEDLDVTTIAGTFTSTFDSADGEEYFQFKSYNDEVWWCLAEEDMGFRPTQGKPYLLAYYDNGTRECPSEPHDCNGEEFVYDDIFLGVYDL